MSKGKSRYLILMLLILGWVYLSVPGTHFAIAQPGVVQSLNSVFGQLYTDSKYILTSPLRWEGDDFARLTAISLTTFNLMIADEDLQEMAQRNRTATTNKVARWTDRNSRLVINSGIAGLYLSGLVLKDKKMRETAFLCLESVALAEGITRGLKYLFGRSRPFGDRGSLNFDPLEFPPPSYSLSFPSGHATAAFAFSSVVAARSSSWLVKLIFYGFATTVSLGRINSNAHFLSDVFFGSVVGISVGRCLVHFRDNNQSHNGGILFERAPQGAGFRISIGL